MYSHSRLAQKYLRYYLTAYNGRGHGMHSPFVFQFILQVLNNQSGWVPPAGIEDLRKKLLTDKRPLLVEDFGAGSRSGSGQTRTVRDIARTALKPKKYAQLLYRLVKHYQPQTILELGTSLGITTAYMASANQAATVITVEGSPQVAEVAGKNAAALSLKNITQQVGRFDDLLPGIIEQTPAIDLAYIDGNHRYEPTLRYFTQLLPAVHNDSVLVFDDIHWSEEMEKAWQQIQQHPAVRCTVDIFFLGFVFFRQEFKTKQHFTIRF